MLHLERPLIFLDCETTGLDRENDRIVSLSMRKITDFAHYPASGQTMSMLINPLIPIPKEATAIHGITDADVANCLPFSHHAPGILSFLEGCDLAGFGSNYYDVPMLLYAFARADIQWDMSKINLIDAGNLFKIMEPRSLSGAVRFYCQREHTEAHTAEGDVNATLDVFVAQLNRYPDLPRSVSELAYLTNHNRKWVDASGKFYSDADNIIRFDFGPHKNKPVLDHPDYIDWMYFRATFPPDTNAILSTLINGRLKYRAQVNDLDDDDLAF